MSQPLLRDRQVEDVRIRAGSVDLTNLPDLITKLLPDQGAIEVQRDVPGKEHVWHRHKTDETLVILDGAVRFYWDQGEQICNPGDVISLPAGVLHGSVALDDGATYLIAFHRAAI
ncbi:MAG TPA: cupin domain-containing protein [Paracoccaceae bacterium]|nr:cupin domain-containing protein [Paracoccaceae bacterium]